MPQVDLSNMLLWDRENLHPGKDGQMAVRPGLRAIYSPAANRVFCGGATVRTPGSDEVRHYIVDALTNAAAAVRLLILDEQFDVVQTLTVNASAIPRVVTVSAGYGQVLISGPDFPTLHCYAGSGAQQAVAVPSTDSTDTALGVPRGISVAWAGRHVVAVGGDLYFSDPLAPRTFVPVNVLSGEWTSTIYGLHVSAEGALIVAAGTGVYALPEDAAASGQAVVGIWSKLTDLRVSGYETTCAARGVVFALTEDGLRQVYPAGEELALTQKAIPRYYGPRISQPDFRRGRLVGGQGGPLVSIQDALHVTAPDGHRAWWRAPNLSSWTVRGVLEDHDGTELLLCEEGVFRVTGNFDGGEALSSEDALPVVGLFAGSIPTPPGVNMVVRETRFASDTSGDVVQAVRGSSKEGTPDQTGIVIGTDSWGDGNYYSRPELEMKRKLWNTRCREVTIEVGAERPLSRVAMSVDVSMGEVGRSRPA